MYQIILDQRFSCILKIKRLIHHYKLYKVHRVYQLYQKVRLGGKCLALSFIKVSILSSVYLYNMHKMYQFVQDHVMLGQVWMCLDKFEHVWTSLNMFRQVWTCLDKSEHVHTSLNMFWHLIQWHTSLSWNFVSLKNLIQLIHLIELIHLI